jgi:hypothetical protein
MYSLRTVNADIDDFLLNANARCPYLPRQLLKLRFSVRKPSMTLLSQPQLTDTITWLMNNASPPVRYLTGKYFLKVCTGSKALTELRHAVETSGDAEEILAKRSELHG